MTKNDLQKTSKALEVSIKEKTDREESANTLQLQSNLTEEEKVKLKKEEKSLKEIITKLEASQSALTRNVQVQFFLKNKKQIEFRFLKLFCYLEVSSV
jgi:hypothetical protein